MGSQTEMPAAVEAYPLPSSAQIFAGGARGTGCIPTVRLAPCSNLPDRSATMTERRRQESYHKDSRKGPAMPITSRLLVQTIKDVTVATFTDASVIDSQHIEHIRRELSEMVDKQNRKRLILDMTKIHHFSSSALGILIPLRERIKALKGDLILCGLRPEICKVFKITKLEKHFTFRADESDALAALNVFVD